MNTVGVATPLAFYSPETGLTVTVSIMRMENGAQTSVSLAESSALSTATTRVYIGSFTPSFTGWYVLHYEAAQDGRLIKADVQRVLVEARTGVSDSPSVSSTPSDDGTRLSAPAVLGSQTGTLSFTVGS